jgi:hypothetical protein
MNDRLNEIFEIIYDLGEFDNEHLLLEPYELATIRIIKVSGELSYNLFSPDEFTSDENDIKINYSSIKNYLIQLFIDSILVVRHVGGEEFNKTMTTNTIAGFKGTFGLEMVNTLQRTVGALSEGIAENSPKLFGAASKLLNAYIFSILDLYNIPTETFYDDVEDYVINELLLSSNEFIIKASNKLKTQFKGKNFITFNVKIDRRKKNSFVGFKVTVKDKTILFSNTSPYKAFLEAVQYVNEQTEFKDIKFLMDLKTKAFINNYSIMFVKENILVENMQKGFYPILAPKGVTDIEGFLEALTK